MAIDAIDISKLLTLYYSESKDRSFPRQRNMLYHSGLTSHREKRITEKGRILVEDLVNLSNIVIEVTPYDDADEIIKEDGVVYAVYYSSL